MPSPGRSSVVRVLRETVLRRASGVAAPRIARPEPAHRVYLHALAVVVQGRGLQTTLAQGTIGRRERRRRRGGNETAALRHGHDSPPSVVPHGLPLRLRGGCCCGRSRHCFRHRPGTCTRDRVRDHGRVFHNSVAVPDNLRRDAFRRLCVLRGLRWRVRDSGSSRRRKGRLRGRRRWGRLELQKRRVFQNGPYASPQIAVFL
mmetsp:Transcript_13796/g.51673  ORF Transcript_13796/g.51673 Transcript_13796/m.51673 type:complete len:202 (-) Transcript_13796:1310-1915(-)